MEWIEQISKIGERRGKRMMNMKDLKANRKEWKKCLRDLINIYQIKIIEKLTLISFTIGHSSRKSFRETKTRQNENIMVKIPQNEILHYYYRIVQINSNRIMIAKMVLNIRNG